MEVGGENAYGLLRGVTGRVILPVISQHSGFRWKVGRADSRIVGEGDVMMSL